MLPWCVRYSIFACLLLLLVCALEISFVLLEFSFVGFVPLFCSFVLLGRSGTSAPCTPCSSFRSSVLFVYFAHLVCFVGRDGLGRSGTFCALYSVLERVKVEQVVDVFQAIKAMRISRPGLVKTAVSRSNTHPSLRTNPTPAPTQTLDLTQGRVGASLETWIDPTISSFGAPLNANPIYPSPTCGRGELCCK